MSGVVLIVLGILTVDDALRRQSEPKTVAAFYEQYKRYGMWLPPKDAKLVRWTENHVYNSNEGLAQRRR